MEFLDNLRSKMDANPSYYKTLGGLAAGAGTIVISGLLIASTPVSFPVGLGLALGTGVAGCISYLGHIKGGKFDFDELKISATTTPDGATKVAAAGAAPAPVIEQKIAKAPEPQPEVTVPPLNIAKAETGVQTGRG